MSIPFAIPDTYDNSVLPEIGRSKKGQKQLSSNTKHNFIANIYQFEIQQLFLKRKQTARRLSRSLIMERSFEMSL